MQSRYLFLLIISLACISFLSSAQNKLYVSLRGNDANPGTITAPFKTPAAALASVRTSKHKNHRIIIRKGTYYLDKPLVINGDVFDKKIVTIESFTGEKVTFSGARKLNTDWKKYKGNIWQTKVTGPDFETLSVNEEPQILARYPNYDSTARVFNGTAKDAISAERMARWKNPSGGYLHALHQGEWGSFHYRIDGVKNGEPEFTGGWQNNRPAPLHKEYRFVENIFEELDAPSEWFLDKTTKTLYFYPSPGVNLAVAEIEVAQLKHLVELRGTEKNQLHDITIKGIRFENTARTFMEHYEPLLRSDWMIYRGAAVLMENTENCIIEDAEFTKLGGNAILFNGRNHASGVTGSHFYEIGASAICFVGDTSAVRSASFGYENFVPFAHMDTTPGPKNNRFPFACFAENNLIHDIGQVEKQSTGVQIEMASEIMVSHNTIYQVPRAGINVGDGCWGGHLIENNDVFETVLETGDHGAFNSWGRDRFWHPDRQVMDNLVAQHPELPFLDVLKPIVIRNNRFRCDHGWDIDLDDGSSNYQIYNNVCLSGGIKFREGFRRSAENNVLINNSFHPHVWFKNNGDVFKNNILMRPYFPIRIDDWGKEVDYNFFPDENALKNAQSFGVDQHSAFGDPDFMDPKAGNYQVKSSSKVLQIGFLNFPMDDFGVTKPELKEIARKVQQPVLLNAALEKDLTETIWLNSKIRNVQGLGDRSAYGLPDEKGVIVVDIPASSLLAKSKIQPGDVIRSANEEATDNVVRLEAIRQQYNWTGSLNLEIIRNQQPILIKLDLK